MPRTRTPTWATSRHPTSPKGWLGIVLAAALPVVMATPAQAAWGVPCPLPKVLSAPPDQSWLRDVPEKPGDHLRGRVAVFVFKGDDVFEPVRAAVVRALRKQHLNVNAGLRPADTPAQYREMSYASHLAVFIDGEVIGQGARQTVILRLRSGVTGQYFTSAKFSGTTPSLVGAIGGTLWARVGSAIIRSCSSAAKPRRRGAEPTYIDASSSSDSPLVGL